MKNTEWRRVVEVEERAIWQKMQDDDGDGARVITQTPPLVFNALSFQLYDLSGFLFYRESSGNRLNA